MEKVNFYITDLLESIILLTPVFIVTYNYFLIGQLKTHIYWKIILIILRKLHIVYFAFSTTLAEDPSLCGGLKCNEFAKCKTVGESRVCICEPGYEGNGMEGPEGCKREYMLHYCKN